MLPYLICEYKSDDEIMRTRAMACKKVAFLTAIF
jgi:hypothetical protein